MRPLTCQEASGELSVPLAGGWIAQRVPLVMATDVALVVPVLASHAIHGSARPRASLPDRWRTEM